MPATFLQRAERGPHSSSQPAEPLQRPVAGLRRSTLVAVQKILRKPLDAFMDEGTARAYRSAYQDFDYEKQLESTKITTGIDQADSVDCRI